MNKREFVLGGCASLAAGSVAAAPLAASAGTGWPHRLPDLLIDQAGWQRLVGQTFAIPSGARLKLLAVEPETVPVLPGGRATEQFDLVFESDFTTPLAAQTHVLEHRSGTRVALFLQPCAAAASGHSRSRAGFSLLV